MKRTLAALLCLLLCLSSLPPAGAEGARDMTFEAALAAGLEGLGLFKGVGSGESGAAEFTLDRAPSRVEAVTMLVRALGKGAQAEGMAKTHPFTDVPPWADGYVSYAWEQGLAKGVSDTALGAEDRATGEMYLTFLLRALGYTEGSAGQFSYTSPWALAAWCGILPPQVDRRDFLRADAVSVTCAALYAEVKGTGTTLHEKLEAEGVFTAEQFAAAFPTDPFADYHKIDAAIEQELRERGYVGPQDRPNVYGYTCHIIAKAEEREDALVVEALVCTTDAELTADNTLGTHGGGAGLWLFRFAPQTLELREAKSAAELDQSGVTQDAAFSPEVVDEWSFTGLSTGMVWLCAVQAQEAIDSGAAAYRRPTYKEAMAQATRAGGGGEFETVRRLEADCCTVLLGRQLGTPRGSPISLVLVYKPGAAMGEGTIKHLPLPAEHEYGLTYSEPQELALSGDGQTLTYSYHYDEAMLSMGGTPGEPVIHEAGTYLYTVDLSTAEVSQVVTPD